MRMSCPQARHISAAFFNNCGIKYRRQKNRILYAPTKVPAQFFYQNPLFDRPGRLCSNAVCKVEDQNGFDFRNMKGFCCCSNSYGNVYICKHEMHFFEAWQKLPHGTKPSLHSYLRKKCKPWVNSFCLLRPLGQAHLKCYFFLSKRCLH